MVYQIKFTIEHRRYRFIDAENLEQAQRIAAELLSSEYYNVIDEEIHDNYDPDTYVNVSEPTMQPYEEEYLNREELAAYINLDELEASR